VILKALEKVENDVCIQITQRIYSFRKRWQQRHFYYRVAQLAESLVYYPDIIPDGQNGACFADSAVAAGNWLIVDDGYLVTHC
jgi:hypothetical protein